MSAINSLFEQLRASGRKALMPFVTAGDPDLDFTKTVIREFAARGCGLCELGIPYSDPIADGPVIQASYTRALARGIRLADVFEMLAAVTSRSEGPSPPTPLPRAGEGSCGTGSLPASGARGGTSPTGAAMPIVTMVSYSIIHRRGLARYVGEARAAGAAGAIVPDLPLEESSPLAEVCRREDFSLIQLIAPTTPRDRALRIVERTTGFIYCVSVTGITGERTDLPPELAESVAWLRQRTALPICIGFGISRPEHVRMLAPVADGLIVGSAIVRRVAAAAAGDRNKVLAEIGQYVGRLLAALEG